FDFPETSVPGPLAAVRRRPGHAPLERAPPPVRRPATAHSAGSDRDRELPPDGRAAFPFPAFPPRARPWLVQTGHRGSSDVPQEAPSAAGRPGWPLTLWRQNVSAGPPDSRPVEPDTAGAGFPLYP